MISPSLLSRLVLYAGLSSPILFAAGGTCPSGSNYLDKTHAATTLSALGITSCYFVAANGADTNSGTDEAHPWLHAPGMPNCANNCGTAWSGTVPAGTGIILRGGDTWHFGNSGASPYTGGIWNFNVSPFPLGTSSNPIYVGYDVTWFTGGSFARPILTGDNATSTSTTLSSCTYQIGSANNFFDFGGLRWFIVDGFEMTGLCQSHVGQPTHNDVYVSYGGASGPLTFQRLYMHGWTHVQFAGPNGGGACTGSAVCFNIFMFNGSVISGSVGETIQEVIVDGSDSDPAGAGLCMGGFYDVQFSVFRYTSQCILNNPTTVHDNLFEYAYENGHSNVLETIGGTGGTHAVYNNVFRHLETAGSTGGVGLWPSPSVGGTEYYFNNVVYDEGSMQLLNIGQNGSNQGTTLWFNNTWEWSQSGVFVGCPSGGVSFPFTDANTHYILENSTPYGANCAGQRTQLTNSIMTHSAATAAGYVSSGSYAYSPPTGGATIGTGTNKQSYCTALSSAGLSAAATACQSDTTYAVSYNSSTHQLSYPARTVVARPASAAWDIGAYQYTGTSAPTVSTTAATAWTATTITAGGNVSSDGGSTVTAYGMCYNTSANPTSPCTTDGSGTGSFTSAISGQSPATTVHYRSYAQNAVGISYGSDLTVTTSSLSGASIVTGKMQ